MVKRLIAFSLACIVGLLLVELLRRRREAAYAPQFASAYIPDPTPSELDPEIAAEIEAALETPPIVREADLAEVAFLAGAVGLDRTPDEDAMPETAESGMAAGEITAYCMHCRAKRTIIGTRLEPSDDGRAMVHGTCSVCGAGMTRFLKTE